MQRILFLVWLAASTARGAAIGQVDTFEDGTTQNWGVALFGVPHPVPPVNIADGGPSGTGDNYLKLQSLGGQGPGSRLVAFNFTQWAGDYTAIGLTSITMNLLNLGPNDLYIRLYLENPVNAPPTDSAITDAVFLPVGSGWTSASFDVSESGLNLLMGSAADLLSNVTLLRIVHSSNAAFPGEAITSSLGVDNICAGSNCRVPDGDPVPESSTLGLLGMGLAALAAFARRP